MNKTNLLTCVLEQPGDKLEANNYFYKTYPGIIYDSSTDSYRYRGYEFNYFKAGIGLPGRDNSYLLIDKMNSQLWLLTYGDQEERWKDYLALKQRYENL